MISLGMNFMGSVKAEDILGGVQIVMSKQWLSVDHTTELNANSDILNVKDTEIRYPILIGGKIHIKMTIVLSNTQVQCFLTKAQ